MGLERVRMGFWLGVGAERIGTNVPVGLARRVLEPTVFSSGHRPTLRATTIPLLVGTSV